MSLDSIRKQSAEALSQALAGAFDYRLEDVTFEVPPRRELGDLAWPGALPLARELKCAPRQIAEAVADTADWPADVARVEIAGPGFVNLTFDDAFLAAELGAVAADAQPLHGGLVPDQGDHDVAGVRGLVALPAVQEQQGEGAGDRPLPRRAQLRREHHGLGHGDTSWGASGRRVAGGSPSASSRPASRHARRPRARNAKDSRTSCRASASICP